MPEKLTQEEFIKRALITHNDRYDYSLVLYKNYETKVLIICKEHGCFTQTPHFHLNGQGCRLCRNEQISKRQMLTTEKFILKASSLHKNKYNYSLVEYINSYKKVKIICKKHGVFEQIAHDHLRRNGCPRCNSSKGEDIIRTWLLDNNIKFEEQKRFSECIDKKPLPFDFYIKDFNLCIEYDGWQHYKPASFSSDKSDKTKLRNFEKIKERDMIKDKFCFNNNITLLRISYLDHKNIESILSKVFQ